MYIVRENGINDEYPSFMRIQEGSFLVNYKQNAYIYFMSSFHEKRFIDFAINNLVDKNKKCIDIGAHVGTYTMHLAKNCKEVYSFECSPRHYNILCGNIAINDLDFKVKKFEYALSDKEGEAEYFFRSKDGGGNGIQKFDRDSTNEKTIVKTRTLDSFEFNDIGFIKIDVEGHELGVLRGALETLKRNGYPKILFESWDEFRENIKGEEVPSRQLRKELFEFILSIGYTITQLELEMFVCSYV